MTPVRTLDNIVHQKRKGKGRIGISIKIIIMIEFYIVMYIPGGPQKNGTVDFLGLCSDQQLSFFTLLDRTYFPHYNNTKIIKFG